MTTTHWILCIAASAGALAAVGSVTPVDATPPVAAPAHLAPVTIRLIDDPRHRAIFCGGDGTETGARYAQVLARDLRRLEASGRTVAQSLAYIEAQACRQHAQADASTGGPAR